MNKFMLTSWLILPVLIVGALWLATDRNAVRRNRDLMHARATTDAGLPEAVAQDGKQPSAAAAPGDTNMVRPESLEQGFVLVVKDLAGLAKADSPIYLASSHNGWDPSDRKSILTSRSDLRWQIVLEKPKINAPMAFKFTRGNWDTCEVDKDLADIPNRSLPLVDASKLKPGEKPVIEFTVPKWADQRPSAAVRPDLNPYYKVEGTGDIRRLQVTGGGVPMLRDVLVWLPPGYDDPANAAMTYPVLYLQDGQNVFMQMPGVPGEWKADETATRLLEAKKIVPLIIVAIPHAGKARASEYLPISVIEGVEPRGKQYVDFLVSEVMPRVQKAFRVRTGPTNTAIGGASLGAVIALEAATSHPELFGKVLMESTPLLSNDKALLRYFAARQDWPPVIYFAMGAKEAGTDAKSEEANKKYADSAAEFQKIAASRMKPGQANVQVIVDNLGTHDENTWARRFANALEMLFQRPVDWKPGN